MDPEETVSMICDAFNNYKANGSLTSLVEAIDLAGALVEWLGKGGFVPDNAHVLVVPLLDAMQELYDHD